MRIEKFLKKTKPRYAFPIFAAVWILAALTLVRCAPPVQDDSVAATAEAIKTWVVQTATQRVAENPNASAGLATAQAQATKVAQNVQATLAAQRVLEASRLDATAQAFSGVRAELPFYGVDPAQEGHPGWVHPDFTLRAEAHNESKFYSDYPETVAKNFVLSSTITWDSRYGTSGCGYVFRANGEQQSPTQYIAMLLRGRFMLFSVIQNGQLANARPIFIDTPSFAWQNGTTNTFTVVARDDELSFYANRVLLDRFNPNDLPPTLYVLPVPPPPNVRTSSGEKVEALELEETPLLPKEIAPESLSYYVQILQDYVSGVQEDFGSYLTYLDNLIEDEQNPETKETLIDYRAIIAYNQALFDQTSGALLALPLNRDQDLVLVPGFLSFAVFNEAGYTECQFDDAWLWILDQER